MAQASGKTWSSGFTFILAAVGAAVGLGNIWKFPYIVGISGGGAFVLVYLGCVLFIAIPILITELWIGRAGGHSPPIAMANVAKQGGLNPGRWPTSSRQVPGLVTAHLARLRSSSPISRQIRRP